VSLLLALGEIGATTERGLRLGTRMSLELGGCGAVLIVVIADDFANRRAAEQW